MKQIQKIIIAIIGMVAMGPVALGNVADALYEPTDTLYFTSEIGCRVIYSDVIDFSTMFVKLVPLSGEKRMEALQILEDAINTPELLGKYFEFELGLVPGVDDFSVNDFTVLGQNNGENEEDDQPDHALRVYFSEYTFIIEWANAGFTTLDVLEEPEKQRRQEELIDMAIELYYTIRHDYEVSQTPQRDSR